MKKYLSLFIFSIIFISNTNYAFSVSPDVFIQSTVNRASQVLSENISKEEKINKLKNIAKETVDIRGVGFYSLGSIRKSLNDDQLKTYSNLFEMYFLKSFSSRLAEYTNPEIEVQGKEILNKNGVIIIHRHKNTKDLLPENFKMIEEKKYGLSKIIFLN